LWRKASPVKRPEVETKQRGIDFAWRVHGAQESWTAKVDGKAAILFTIELVLLAALIAAHGHGKLIGRMHHDPRLIAEIGTVLAFASTFLVGGAVIPRLGRTRQHKTQRFDHLIYFGHLRHWEPQDLQSRLEKLTAADELEQLSRQLVEMSKLNWAKHRWLQAAMVLALFGVVLIAISIYMSMTI
jgi:hypothetical protein